ncbi:MAG: MotA/TolQ/ExbB proton channel family protein [Elusimicrobiota bacterium]|nr:MAG: MotA/TolQ/ExbB proton channel family protein [Elusimicrobiota bacterium]
MPGMTFVDMLKISIAMPILLVLSLAIFAQALERLYSYWVAQKMPTSMWERVRDRLEAGDKAGALAIARRDTSLMGEAIARLLSLDTANPEKLVEAFQVYRARLSMGLNRRVGLFGTASFVSPLIGLMGTVLGIMRAFHDLSAAGAGGPAVVAAGISEALVATAFGIGLAVFAALLYNYFTLTARHRLQTADLWVLEMAQLLEITHGGQPVS